MDDTRRRHLLAIANLEKYAIETFNDIYYSLTTSSRDNGKIKTDCIYGNGVVENQIAKIDLKTDTPAGSAVSVPNSYFASYTQDSTNGITFTTVAFTGLWNLGYNLSQNQDVTYYSIINGHKYLMFAYAKASVANVFKCQFALANNVAGGLTNIGSSWTLFAGILTSSSTNYSPLLYFGNIANIPANETISVKDWCIVDLTLMFGTGNEPTVLTDNRIQALLNRGYIPYNAGTYKPAIVEELVMEPYNLFDGELEIGTIDTGTGQNGSNNNHLRTKNYISVVGGNTYTLETNLLASQFTVGYIYEYDEYKNYLGSQNFNRPVMNNSNVKTLSNQTKFIRFRYYGTTNLNGVIPSNETCFHRTGTRTGYAPYPEWLKLNHFVPNTAGSVSDSYKDFVFTRNAFKIDDLSSLTFGVNQEGTNTYRFSCTLSNGKSNGQGSCNNFPWVTSGFSNDQELIGVLSGTLYLRILKSKLNNTYTSQALHDWLVANLTNISYELATPQTITMANNCLQCVDLGTLTWAQSSSYPNRWSTDNNTVDMPAIGGTTTSNVYCSKYMAGTPNTTYSAQIDMSISSSTTGKYLQLVDSSLNGLTSAQVSQKLSGIYLFHETASPINEIASGVFTQKNVIYTPSAIQLDGALNAKNTLQITPQNYVITRNVWQYTFSGSESWSTFTNDRYYCDVIRDIVKKPTAESDTANAVMETYTTIRQSSLTSWDKAFCIATGNGNIMVRNTTTSSISTTVANTSITFELATPQTTTIARKHLKAVDLSTLDFAYNSTDKAFYVQLTDMVNSTYYSKVFTPNYLGEIITTLSGMGDRHVAISNRWLYIKDLRYNTASAFKAAVAGQYLWYETTNEVDDMVNKALFENGGCIRACEFGWVENQIINDGNFPSTTNWKTNSVTLSASDNTLTITSSQSNPGWGTYQNGLPIISTHKYALMMSANLNSGLTEVYGSCGGGNNESYGTPTQNTWTKVCHIFSNVGSGNAITIYVRTGTGSVGDTLKLKEVNLIDLTQAFGAGNEPTSINDWRIQYILNKGYIPTNTTGTLKHIDTEVLPSADMKVQQ